MNLEVDKVVRWIVCSALPYAYSMPHIGNFIGSFLSADVFARYHRLKGDEVLFVSGSDEHGTPIEVEAIKRHVSPLELSSEFHSEIQKVLDIFEISTDNYTRTNSPTHMKFIESFFSKIYEKGFIFAKKEEQLYCEQDNIFLPDRFVTGKCPICEYDSARGDQCENCGTLLNPSQLIDPHCVVCGKTPSNKETINWYFDLPRFENKLEDFLSKSETLTANAKNFSLQMVKGGLQPRSITRDNKWGVPAPFPGASGKTIYVWFEALLCYISAVIEYFLTKEKEDEWKKYWLNKETRIAFFIGKDNIPFHTIILPSLLMASGEGYTMNFYVGATEFLLFEGKKFSKSKKMGMWLDEVLKLLPAEYWRFSLMLLRPEVKDTNFSWEYLERSINEDLNNQIGNLTMRLFTLLQNQFGGAIPRPNKLTKSEISLTEEVKKTIKIVEEQMNDLRLQRALVSIMDLVRGCNSLLNEEEPWKKIYLDKDEAGGTLYTIASALKAISIMLIPFIPNFASKLLTDFGIDPRKVTWDDIENPLPLHHKITTRITPPFSKVDAIELKSDLEKLRNGTGTSALRTEARQVDIEDFAKIDIRIGEILGVKENGGKGKFLILKIDVGGEVKTCVAGVAGYYKPEELVGKKVAVVCNLKPKKIAGILSEAMVMAAVPEGGIIALLNPDKDVVTGTKVL